jgi:glutamyl-Q tRNA(Asp) synthetase
MTGSPTGRFAPSPTGELHFGSLVAAVASFLDVRSRNGRWLVRVEDLDPPREVEGAAERQLSVLKRFGMVPDEPPIYQSRRRIQHDAALADLLDRELAFPCACTRKQLPDSGVYPGTCRTGIPLGQTARSIRFRTGEDPVTFHDAVFGSQTQVPARQTGDFIIRRGDGLIAYQLAVVVDDADAGITDIVRGSDLLDSTGRQILLQRALRLPTPNYIHLPLMVDVNGRKLSKSDNDDPVAALPTCQALTMALSALGHRPPGKWQDLDSIWSWSLENWDRNRIPRTPMVVQAGRIEGYTPEVT